MGYFYSDEYLAHHGILGQKWGVRRFQNRDGTRTAAGKQRQQENSKHAHNGLTDEQKRAIKIGAGIVAGCVIAYGGYKLATNPKAKALATNVLYGNKDKRLADLDKEISNMGPEIVKKSGFGGSSEVIGKSFNTIDDQLVRSINKDGWVNGRLDPDYARNCTHTSIAYIMNSVLGKNVTAKGYGGVDEISGMVTGDHGRDKGIFDAVFDGLDKTELAERDRRPDRAIENIKNGTTGILRLERVVDDELFGHFINYEKDSSGNVTFVDCQSGSKIPINKSVASKLGFEITDIIDCSNATLREDATKTLKYLVK